MKYIILADAENHEKFKIPRQLSVVDGEPLVGRTVRLLKQNGINSEDIIITSHDKRFDAFGVQRFEKKEDNKYWVNAFPRELIKRQKPITFLFGDVYFSENAIKTIIKTETTSIMFFCSDGRKGYSKDYIKHHDEPFAFKVVDCDTFRKHIDMIKKLWDDGKTR